LYLGIQSRNLSFSQVVKKIKQTKKLNIVTYSIATILTLFIFVPQVFASDGESWKGSYSDTKSNKKVDATHDSIHFNWGYGSPINGIPKDSFTATFTKDLKVDGKTDYFIKTFADDGIRVKVNDVAIIDRWSNSAGVRNTGIVPTLEAGTHSISTEYYEAGGNAVVYADVVPLGDWVAYYYNNTSIKGYPVNSRVIKATDNGLLSEDHGYNSPISKVSKDKFSAEYETAKVMPKGDYIIRTRADDGVRVYVDGKLVLNRWSTSNFKEDAVKITLSDRTDTNDPNLKEVHWIKVEYLESTGKARLDVSVKPVEDELQNDSWVGMYFSNKTLSGSPIVKGGTSSVNELSKVAFDWGYGRPEPQVPYNNFSASFIKKIEGGQDYFVRTFADDGLKVLVDNKPIIDRWSNSAGKVNEALITNLQSGAHTLRTDYYEAGGNAIIYSDVVPFGTWLAYYYPNTNLKGAPANSRVVEPSKNGQLSVDYGYNSPIAKVPKDKFTAEYVTAKRLSKGDYIIRTRADDGVRVYVDNKLVLDRWSTSNFREDAVKVTISDRDTSNSSEKDVHWIRVEYFESAGKSRLDFSIKPLSEELSKSEWVGTYYPNKTLSGIGVTVGGNGAVNKVNRLAFDLGYNKPHQEIPKDNFSASYQKLISGNTDYFVQTFADDGVKVSVDGKSIINRWSNSAGNMNRGLVTGLSKGDHVLQTDYYDAGGNAILYADAVPFGDWLAYYYPNTTLKGKPVNSEILPSENGALFDDNGYNAPKSGVPKDYFSARYVTAKRISAGEYIIRARADDGVRVLIDGKTVLDRWTGSTYREDAVKINISDHAQTGSTHWVEVQYFDNTNHSKVNVSIEPYHIDEVVQDSGWLVEYYPTKDLKGTPYIVGGKGSMNQVNSINYDWVYGSPHRNINSDNFSAVYYKKQYTSASEYDLQVEADDGVRVYIDGELKIDQWKNGNNIVKKRLELSEGTHTIKVVYYENTGKAKIKFALTKVIAGSYQQIDLRTPANITAQDIVDFFNRRSPNSPLKDHAQAFINAQNKYGVNAQYLVAHAIWETGWSGSNLRNYKYNLYGYGAYDTCPFTCGYYFPSGQDSIEFVAYQVRTDYLNPDGKYYNGSNLPGMNVRYATDQNWQNGIANLMNSIKEFKLDADYYEKQKPLPTSNEKPGNYGRDIPDGNPYPKDVVRTFQGDILGKANTTVNFRSIPYLGNAHVIDTVNNGATVKILGVNQDVKLAPDSKADGDRYYKDLWYRVSVNGKIGWLYGEYVDLTNLTVYQVNATSLNIRSGASTGDGVIGSVKDKTYLQAVLDDKNNPVTKEGWYQIYLPESGSTGWVSEDFVKKVSK